MKLEVRSRANCEHSGLNDPLQPYSPLVPLTGAHSPMNPYFSEYSQLIAHGKFVTKGSVKFKTSDTNSGLYGLKLTYLDGYYFNY